MQKLSSSSTIIFSLFLPVFWFVFFGAFGLAIWLTDADTVSIQYVFIVRISYTFIFLFFGFLVWRYALRLKRIEYSTEKLYITNYFKTIQLNIDDILSIHHKKLLNLYVVRIRLKKDTMFGNKISTISDEEKYNSFLLNAKHISVD